MKVEEHEERLVRLAHRYLCTEGQECIVEFLSTQNIRGAQVYLLGSIDALFVGGKILDEDAKSAYEIIGIHPEDASEIRQRCKKF